MALVSPRSQQQLLHLVSSGFGSEEIMTLGEEGSQLCRDKGSSAGEPQAPSMAGIAVGAGNDSQGSWTLRRHLSVCPRKYTGEFFKGMEFLLKKMAVVSW